MVIHQQESERASLPGERGNGGAGGIMTVSLDHDFAMVGVARRAVRRWLHERGCRTADDAALVFSELVTNAMVHAGAGCTIAMQHDDDRVRLEVRDPSPTPPVIAVLSPHNVGGRGLHVVQSIVDAWGWEPTVDGKRVWANIDAPEHRAGAEEDPESTLC
jgi:anti-sigma regulatory factor (Ser/Thr protein kinase)